MSSCMRRYLQQRLISYIATLYLGEVVDNLFMAQRLVELWRCFNRYCHTDVVYGSSFGHGTAVLKSLRTLAVSYRIYRQYCPRPPG